MNVIEIYMDWVDNFLSIEKFAEHHNFSEEFAHAVIKEGKRKCKDNHPLGSVFKLEDREFVVCEGSCGNCSLNGNVLCGIDPPCVKNMRKYGISVCYREVVKE